MHRTASLVPSARPLTPPVRGAVVNDGPGR
jgi:hypothetical protein